MRRGAIHVAEDAPLGMFECQGTGQNVHHGNVAARLRFQVVARSLPRSLRGTAAERASWHGTETNAMQVHHEQPHEERPHGEVR